MTIIATTTKNSYYVGLIKYQYTTYKNNPKTKIIDEPVSVRSFSHLLDVNFFNLLIHVDINNTSNSQKIQEGLPKAIEDLKSASKLREDELALFDNKSERTSMEDTGRRDLQKAADTIAILYDRFVKIQKALNSGSTLKTACKPYKLCHNEKGMAFNGQFTYEHPKLFTENQLECNK